MYLLVTLDSGYVRLYWQGRPSGKGKEVNKKGRGSGSVLAKHFEKKVAAK